jgi:hypothetical protein
MTDRGNELVESWLLDGGDHIVANGMNIERGGIEHLGDLLGRDRLIYLGTQRCRDGNQLVEHWGQPLQVLARYTDDRVIT